MPPQKRLPKSLRKFLRRKKAEIRRRFLSPEEAESKIRELVSQIYPEYPKEKQDLRRIRNADETRIFKRVC